MSEASSPEESKFDSREFIASLSEGPGVYRMLGQDGALLYVGKAKNLKRRVSSYFQKTGLSPRIALMVKQIAGVEVTVTRSEAEALIMENTLIKKLLPKYNILFRDDKSYPYIALSGGDYPRLYYHRGALDKKSRYFGPFPSGFAARESIQFIQKTFLLRTCEDAVFSHRSRPCLMHQIKRCKGPCVGLVPKEDYDKDVRTAEHFLQGRHAEVIEGLTADMESAAHRLRFEQAAEIRDQIRSLQTVLHRQYVSSTKEMDVDIVAVIAESGELCINLGMIRAGLHLGDRACISRVSGLLAGESPDLSEGLSAFLDQHYAEHPVPARIFVPLDCEIESFGALNLVRPRTEQERAWMEMARKNAQLALGQHRQTRLRGNDRTESLRDALALSETPRRIECFDVSHTMGEGTVASCVVCVDGLMKRSDYRRFNIEGVQPGDDYAAMRQALTRRYEKLATGEISMPDLVLIDGGKGQHSVAREVLADLGLDHLLTVGVAKGEGRKPGLETLLVHGQMAPLHLSMDHPGFHLIQEIRDEAHRFAIVGHRARRAKVRSASSLESIAGVGPAKRRKLLSQFGGLEGVRGATVEDLSRVGGVSIALAQAIHDHLHSN
ncbi:MAG: excinuclease ABC subunit UvrC [Rhodocyclaceae bacterium]|jgi:excinuclease ABC subunit C|nr:excinuclease ABC subunit UvrC [Rhodocyclaceae bacterium]